MNFSVEAWDPAYDLPVDFDEFEESTADVAVDVELPGSAWRAISPGTETTMPSTILFVDGVRRIDARIWIDDGAGSVEPGICASYAAGLVRCDGVAEVLAVDVRRTLFSASSRADDIVTSCASYSASGVPGSSPNDLSIALQESMSAAERAIAARASAAHTEGLLVIDGQLRGREDLPGAVGFIKTHNRKYLPPDQHRVIGTLDAGQRCPVFCLGTSWRRYSWYLRLPGPRTGPWTGVVRCEVSADMAPAAAIVLADTSSMALPRFASHGHKDPRAPQNLYPVGGLERELRRRLGDQHMLTRALRVAAGMPLASRVDR